MYAYISKGCTTSEKGCTRNSCLLYIGTHPSYGLLLQFSYKLQRAGLGKKPFQLRFLSSNSVFLSILSSCFSYHLVCSSRKEIFKMHAVFYTLLSYVSFDWIWRLNRIRDQFLTKWYHYFPNPTPKHLCRVCKETLQSKSGGSAADGFIEPSEDSGQEQFETYGQVTCPHHTSVQTLRDSADENCMICSPV